MTLQAVVIIYGVLATGVTMKAVGYPEGQHFSDQVMFIRKVGLVFLLIPALWAWGTLKVEFGSTRDFRIWSFLTGVILLALLWWYFTAAVGSAMVRPGPIQAMG